MSRVAEMIPVTRNGCTWKPPPSSRATIVRTTMKSALRGQDKLVNSLGEHCDGGNQQGDRDGHEHDGLAVHHARSSHRGSRPRTGGGRGSPSSSTERGCGVFMVAPTLRLAARPESPHPQAR
jgi:hypothetical protein